jgi:Saccharopine dehydrogenase NADP binding domain
MKVLILGGYGVFGGRLAQLLADTTLHLLIAGRDLTRAQAFCAAFQGHAEPVQADRATIAQTLKTQRPDILVDATGPFQDYGPMPYSVLQARISTRTNYLDFADGAAFVAGVSQFDPQARAAGIFALSGVSSFPVLTAAVLRETARSIKIAQVTGGIAPSPHAGVGLNVLRAALGLPGLAALAPLAHSVLNALKYGEHRGGMFIEATGKRDGHAVTRSWHMLAESDDGPHVPSLAIEALIR